MKKENRRKPALLSVRILFTSLILSDLLLVLLISWIVSKLGKFLPFPFEIPDLLWFYVVSILLGGAIAYFLSNWFLKPLMNLGLAMRQVAAGDYSVRLETEKGLKEIRQINANFNLMAKELGATEILQTDFVSNVSHEFKTPISAIEGYVTLLQGIDSTMTEEQSGYIDRILANTHRLSTLVGNILLLSKIDNQAISAKQSLFRLDEQIRQVIVMQESEWGKKDIEFDVELDEIEYKGNENLLFHVWNNLLSNAVKFSPSGGLITMKLFRQEKQLIFMIEDEGCGVSEDARKHIFDKFYQADNSHKEEGNGLGLALVKQILLVTNGEIIVENRTEGGCRFQVFLQELD